MSHDGQIPLERRDTLQSGLRTSRRVRRSMVLRLRPYLLEPYLLPLEHRPPSYLNSCPDARCSVIRLVTNTETSINKTSSQKNALKTLSR